ncbi:MAG: RagB/SusD family nutrient uptake outer membrane protein [Phaeodactylibacter sp.]|nr:RagB/SusD family nutrient uptake outer membrane protein [Phaeodactylibacter sp.]MCB9051919.1 RagB/SusD family nutrient uptake outer membrane protein [Lewinellaceae bacterium]
MKKYKISILSLVVFMLGATGCNQDRLDVEPVNEFLSANFYQTEDQVFSALVAAYDPLGWTMAYGNWISSVMFGEIRSDNANAGGDPSDNDQPGWQEFDDFRNTNTNTVTHPIYRRNYIGIFRANLVISNAQISTPLVERFQAEAKFLRAYYHFELFKHFGPIPVVTETLTPDDVDRSRNTMSEVFEAIVSDLNDAIAVLPATISANEVGRANKGAAHALLGKAYLYWADMDKDDPAKFALAAEHLQAVVDLGIYSLEDDIEALYDIGVKNPAESVFELQQSNLYPSNWGWFEGIDGNGMVQLCGVRGLCEDHPTYQAGWGFMLPTQDLYDHYLPDDTYRRDAAIITVDELAQEIQEAGVVSCPVVVDETQGNPVDNTGYWQEKYSNYKSYLGNNVNGGDPNLTKDADIYAIRYADVLLMLAEALHRSGGSDAQAMEYIDIVRERAAGPGDNTGNFRTAQQLMSDMGWTLQDVIWYERRAELAMEGDRWFDLVRSGRANVALFAGDPIRESNFTENDLWLPIALEELSVAPNLTEYPDASLFQ